MYKTRRSQRRFLEERGLKNRGQGKISRVSQRQLILCKDSEGFYSVKEIRHQKPFKNSGAALKFMSRHGIKPMTLIANKWKPPTNKIAIKAEKELIKNKASKLSRYQREIIMSL